MIKKILATRLIAIVSGLILMALTACAQTAPESGRVLLVSFDGFRYDYLDKTETPHFDAFIREGVMAEGLIPVFPSKTFPNHYAIATGLYPENNGIVGNTMYDPVMEQWYRIRDRSAVEEGDWYLGEPIWNSAEKQGRIAGTMFWVGSEADIGGRQPTYWKPFDGSMPYRARIDTLVSWMARDDRPAELGTLYIEEVDTQGHRHGTESESLVNAIRQADVLLGYLKGRMSEEGIWEDTDILLVSDHGMIDLAADKTIRLDELIDPERITRMTLGPVTMLQPDSGQTDRVYRRLKEAENHYRVYRKEELPEQYHLKGSRRVMDLVLVAEMPFTVVRNQREEAQFRKRLPRGNHGYESTNRAMHGFFAARGSSFAAGDTVAAFRNIHIYSLAAYLLGITPAPNDGSLDSVRTVLRQH